MARITVEDCLQVVPSRFDLIIMASKRARQLTTTSRDPLVSGIMISQHWLHSERLRLAFLIKKHLIELSKKMYC